MNKQHHKICFINCLYSCLPEIYCIFLPYTFLCEDCEWCDTAQCQAHDQRLLQWQHGCLTGMKYTFCDGCRKYNGSTNRARMARPRFFAKITKKKYHKSWQASGKHADDTGSEKKKFLYCIHITYKNGKQWP